MKVRADGGIDGERVGSVHGGVGDGTEDKGGHDNVPAHGVLAAPGE